ncbi:CrcB family protein [Rhodohalobacter sp.]|uniref:fluoride efflux transporter FluC n=1 Tax=Rhodohalobacter sp. TaxID=1974210 RepID=UPI002ACEDCB1|nr:CrcB family protein [Rhodohalobacter sp.]MDZ7755766.1 CrcB family protein [Rhodohalobacter sp.]
MLDFFLIAVGGAIGATLRYLTSIATIPINKRIPFLTGTVFANSFGCLIAGAFTAAISVSNPFSDEITTMLSIGVLSSYTTFSTFSLEVFQRLDQPLPEILSYLFMQLVVAIGLVFAGYSFTLHWMGGAA